MPQGVKFNIMSFGSAFETVFGMSVTLSDATVEFALNKLSTFEANMGSSNLVYPLEYLFNSAQG